MATWYERNRMNAEAAANAQQTAQAQQQAQAQADLEKSWKNVKGGGFSVTPSAVERMSDLNLGLDLGKRQFSQDPRMMEIMEKRREALKGYDSGELSAMRNISRNEMDANRQKSLQTMRSNLGRSGVGGARGAAAIASADAGLQKAAQDTERKMLLDQASLKREALNAFADQAHREKLGEAGYAIASGQFGSADRAAAAGVAANNSGGKK